MKDSEKPADGKLESQTAGLSIAIARTRAEMGGTLEAIHGRLNPEVLKDEVVKQFIEAKESIKSELRADLALAKESLHKGLKETKESLKSEFTETKQHLAAEVKSGLSEAKSAIREATIGKVENMAHNAQETVKAAGRTFAHTISENPVPAALIGVGLVWLYAGSASRQRDKHPSVKAALHTAREFGEAVREKTARVAHSVEHAAHQASSTALDAAHSASDTLGRLTSEAKTSVVDTAHAASETVNHLAHSTASQGRRVRHRAEETFTRNPLAVGAAFVAVGAAVGLSIPITHVEDEWMGDVRDEVIHKAEALASDICDKVDDAAKHITETATATKSAENVLPEPRDKSTRISV